MIGESTIQQTNLPLDCAMVDSLCKDCYTEFSNISNDSNTYTDTTEFSVKSKKRKSQSANELTASSAKPQVVEF